MGGAPDPNVVHPMPGYRNLMMPGVTVGHGAVVASGAVMVDDVPRYGIVGGNPAKLIRRRFRDEDVERLLRIAWWDWPVEKVTVNVRAIMAGRIEELEG